MKSICINCRYVGSIISKEGLVCGRKNFKSVNSDDTCDEYIQGICERCGDDDIDFYKNSPKDKPYIVRIEYTCKSCGHFWYEDKF